MRGRTKERGLSLVEVLITLAIISLITGFAMFGPSAASGARLRRSATMVAAAVRVAYAHANAISKPVRIVFDLDERTIGIEESSGNISVRRNDKTGGAAAATEAEKKAIEEAEAILKGPRPSRPTFKPTQAFGFNPEKGRTGKELEKGIRFLQLEVDHQDEPSKQGRAYLYFWPGGQTERAAIQLRVDGSDLEKDMLTVLVSPLTGKAELKRGRASMPKPRDETEASERRDGF